MTKEEHRRLFDAQMKAKVASLRESAAPGATASYRSSLEDHINMQTPHVRAAVAGGTKALTLATRVTAANSAHQLLRIEMADLYGAIVNLQRAAYSVGHVIGHPMPQPTARAELSTVLPANAVETMRASVDATTELLLRVLSVQRTQLRASQDVAAGLSSFEQTLEEHSVTDATLRDIAIRSQSSELVDLLGQELATFQDLVTPSPAHVENPSAEELSLPVSEDESSEGDENHEE
jgi:hypothetical protein